MVYYFGIENTIRKLFSIEEFCRKRGTQRDNSDAGSWWGSQDAKRMQAIFKEQGVDIDIFTDDRVSTYGIGFDFATMFNFKDHSTGIDLKFC